MLRQMLRRICIGVALISLFFNTVYVSYVSAADINYVLDGKQRVPIPLTYKVKNVIDKLDSNTNTLKQPEDIFIDRYDNIYIADTGNNRIVKYNSDGKLIYVYGDEDEKDKQFNNPMGLFVDDDEDIYVADTANNCIAHLSPYGEFVEQFVKPESLLLNDSFTFEPTKIYINSTGFIYILKSHSFVTIDADNNFRGYVGANQVEFDFTKVLIRLFASKEQKERIAKNLPDSYTNFVIDKNGVIYATCYTEKQNQIVKLNSVGKNIFRKGSFGETIDDNNRPIKPRFIDIAVDANGIINALDQISGKVYQYDQEGNLLTVFGGIGTWKGTFQMPSSISVDSHGNIYVLDRILNNVQVFEPTSFIKLIHEAIGYYDEGEYVKAKDIWNEVIKFDKNYKLAHTGIAKVLMKERKWKEAMNEYEMADDKAGYTKAFNEYRKSAIQEYFGLIILIVIVIITILIIITGKVKNAIGNLIENFKM
ncbi:MAG TPA: NHL repeat-containing protein [Clostridiales bacterium]|nr:NHL repeat-containing protein [Clostridiales bacterium]